jgi:CRP/FNR family transcriptional regulator, anaerobic regulatory protein
MMDELLNNLSGGGGAPRAKWDPTRTEGIEPDKRLALPDTAQLPGARIRLRRNGRLYRAGDPFESLFVLRYGFLKSTAGTEDGREQVIAFHLQGDLVGFDGIATHQYCCETTALENSEVIAVPYASLQGPAAEAVQLREHVHRAMSRELIRKQKALLVLGNMKAEQRVAAFDLAQRFKARGYSRSEFVLRMTRAEIGSYLGVTLETISRCFSRFAQEGLIVRSGRHVRINDSDSLAQLVNRADAGARAPTREGYRSGATDL